MVKGGRVKLNFYAKELFLTVSFVTKSISIHNWRILNSQFSKILFVGRNINKISFEMWILSLTELQYRKTINYKIEHFSFLLCTLIGNKNMSSWIEVFKDLFEWISYTSLKTSMKTLRLNGISSNEEKLKRMIDNYDLSGIDFKENKVRLY